MLVREWNAGDKDDLLEVVCDGNPAGAAGVARLPAPPRQHEQTGGFDRARGRLYSPVPMREQRVAVRIEEVGRSKLAQISSKLRHGRKTRRERRHR